MKVYGANLSPFVRKVLVVCKLKQLDFEHEVVMPGTKTPEYLAISPLGKIPALTDGELGVSDSSVICDYLEEKYPAIAVLPTTPELRARSRWYEEYADSKLAENFAVFFFERFLKRVMKLGAPDEERLANIVANNHPEVLAYLESQVPEQGFMFGESMGTADIALLSPFINAAHTGFEPDLADYPKLDAWMTRVKTHPVMVDVLAAEAAMLKAMAG
jgi:glutathione S-transferase